MKKWIIVFLVILVASKSALSQTGINTRSPLTTLHVEASNIANPGNIDGVIIPRVTNLNVTSTKEKGLLVFYDKEDAATEEIEKGFYYWDGVKWIPFFAMNKITTNRTIAYANTKNTFNEGAYTLSTSGSSTRNLGFVGPVYPSSVSSIYTINTNGEFVIGKKGYYDITTIVSLNVVAVGGGRRDAFEITLMVNGVATSIKTAYGFPNSGNDYDLTTGITLGGALLLNVNDRISININRYNVGNSFGSPTSINTNPVGALSNITLRYMGDF